MLRRVVEKRLLKTGEKIRKREKEFLSWGADQIRLGDSYSAW